MARIRGRVIRIVDARTAIINLGRRDGVTPECIFSVLGEPEPIVDPVSDQVLGNVAIVKIKLKAADVNEAFTIATTRWSELRFAWTGGVFLPALAKRELVDQGEMLVDKEELQPWKAKTEIPVHVGDLVEVEVKDTREQADQQEGEQGEERNGGKGPEGEDGSSV
ncbi:MAG TPA: hypothetical protein VFJ58_17105 [Armatimonadota bacterium]|nr:hypothetical protein [Armatimonadota bacterium]